ncbi:MAG: hypothetical protein KDA22_09530 [Phycisphaerales bacterium]|nr:hypothetical protein [Phycisphaerales bacterium]
MRMRTCLPIWSSVCTAVLQPAASAAPPDAVEGLAIREEVALAVASVMADRAPIVTRYRVASWWAGPPGQERQRDADEIGDCLRQWSPVGWRPPTGDVVHMAGPRWSWTVNPLIREATVRRAPSDPHDLVSELFQQREGFDGWAAMPTLAEQVAASRPRSWSADGSIVTYVYVAPREDQVTGTSLEHEIVVDTAAPARILSQTLRVPHRDGEPGWRQIVTVAVESWEELSGRPLPRVVVRRAGTGELVSVDRFERRSARIPEAAELATWRFEGPVEPGWRLRDTRIGLEWTVGSREILFRGRRLRLREPLYDHPADRLAGLVAAAEIVENDGDPGH